MARRVIDVPGLQQFRRDLRRVDKEADKELRRAIRDATGRVADRASVLAPRRTGALADSYQATVVRDRGLVRSRLPYARFIEYGFHPRGGSTFIQGREPVNRARDQEADSVAEAIGDGIEQAALRAGWH